MRAIALVALASLLSGLLLAWALPPANAPWLGWVALAPVLAAVKGRGFIPGFLAGVASLFVCAFAIKLGISDHSGPADGEPAWLYTGCGFFGFVVALVAGLVGDGKDVAKGRAVWLAAVAVLLELALFVVLPAHLALTQYRVPTMLGLASLTGIWGVSYVVWLSNLVLARALVTRDLKAAGGITLVAAAVCLVPWFGGKTGTPNIRRITAVQSEDSQIEDLERWEQASAMQGAWLSVWPEFGGMMGVRRGNTQELRDIASQPGNPPFVTSFPDDHEPLPHNTAALFTAAGESSRYYKRKLFGGEVNMHTPGNRPTSVMLDGETIGLAICYDSCYPAMLRDSAREAGVSLIVLPTIDPDSPHAFVASIHAAFTPFRAAELGIPIVRADGGAYSMAVEAGGRILGVQPPGAGYLASQVPLESRWTLYKALGDWFLYACAAVVLGGIASGFRQKLAKRPADSLNEETPTEEPAWTALCPRCQDRRRAALRCRGSAR